MHLSDLQTKDVVNINDGKKIGRIIDAAINDAGIIEYLSIEKRGSLKRIGEDVILVDIMI